MTDRITPQLSAAATKKATEWLTGAPRTTIRGITGATDKNTHAMRMFIKLETGLVVTLDAAEIERLESSIKKIKRAHEEFLGSKG